ncbi:hypothetical protein [Ramlibacter algicola]|uniref:Uncharacterized protein n=1 Tax=Ramlibacter algicola TaxID=2795217 RepID=A0A934Q1P2_9BURK|nr:hypothetical protein [Ramlibacter algicola]MBK0393478.1 hypothetical protein [Ramlibacter algicola]
MSRHAFACIVTWLAALAAVPPSSAAEAIDVGSPQLRLSTTLAWPPTPEATFSARIRQPASALQAQVAARQDDLLQAMDQAQRQQKQMNDLQARLAQAQDESRLNPVVVALAGLLLALTAGAAAFWWRLRGLRAPDASA